MRPAPLFRFLAAFLFLATTLGAQAEERGGEIRVATRILPPMVIERNGELTGFSIELWNRIAGRLKLKTNYSIRPNVGALLDAVDKGDVQLGVSAVSITAERSERFDFSQPMLNAGTQIMVRGGAEGSDNPLLDLLRLLFSPAILLWLGIAALLVVVPSHLVWLLERNHPNGIITNRNYFPGIFQAAYWAAGTLATQADQMPRHWLARIISLLWMFTGVVFVAFYTAQLTATLTVQQIQGSINGPDDLPGKRVATTQGSTAVPLLRELKADVQEFGSPQEMFDALAARKVDAVVTDGPILLYYVSNEGKGKAQVVGPVIRKEDYGIVFRTNDPMRRTVDNVLLSLREDGTYQQIYDKWFKAK